ncbi:hypothetical protein EX30DRAFT_339219 [Ascodesmis nigricans]|uniref:SGF29 C-terminal domain-containing protein n=1 Tax=Ascodesmis nigricans TaxID=341454 RepID=A0A4S2N1L6_9PEZI|nr:hypothetical protein EX30DRAFT_339219 [Ascodesmis nigricans]
MAARGGRPRAGAKDEAATHEERDLWSKIVIDLKDLTRQSKRASDQINAIKTLEYREDDQGDLTRQQLAELEKLYQDQKRAAEDEQAMLKSVLERNDLLIALRAATEGGDRGGVLSRERVKRKHDETISADSPSNRNPKLHRSNSAAPTEVLQLHSDVAYRLPKQKGAEGEWIQCTVIGILGGEGGKRRYEVQDPEPDEAGGHGKYRALASALIPIPKDSAGLAPYPNGKQVLARYPETTTFYKAEVIGTKRDGTCRLRFEGEEEVGKETEVERRLVLDVGDRR